MDPVDVERGEGVEEDGGGDVRLTCNELKKLELAIFLTENALAGDFSSH